MATLTNLLDTVTRPDLGTFTDGVTLRFRVDHTSDGEHQMNSDGNHLEILLEKEASMFLAELLKEIS